MGVKVDLIDIDKSVEAAKKLLEKEQVSPGLKAALDVLFLLITLLCNRLTLNSSNSSKPPSSDPIGKNQNESRVQENPEDKLDIKDILWKEIQILIL